MSEQKPLVFAFIGGMQAKPSAFASMKEAFEKAGLTCTEDTPLCYHEEDVDTNNPPSGLGKTGLLDYADDLEQKLRVLENTPLVLVGWSMGGLIASIVATRLPNVVGMILLAPAPSRGNRVVFKTSVQKCFRSAVWVKRRVWKIPFVFPRWGFWYKPNKATFEEFCYGMVPLAEPARQQELYQYVPYESGRAGAEIAFWWWPSFWRRKPSHVDMASMNFPILIVQGDQDNIVPIDITQTEEEKFRRHGCTVTYYQLPGQDHWLVDKSDVHELCLFWIKKSIVADQSSESVLTR